MSLKVRNVCVRTEVLSWYEQNCFSDHRTRSVFWYSSVLYERMEYNGWHSRFDITYWRHDWTYIQQSENIWHTESFPIAAITTAIAVRFSWIYCVLWMTVAEAGPFHPVCVLQSNQPGSGAEACGRNLADVLTSNRQHSSHQRDILHNFWDFGRSGEGWISSDSYGTLVDSAILSSHLWFSKLRRLWIGTEWQHEHLFSDLDGTSTPSSPQLGSSQFVRFCAAECYLSWSTSTPSVFSTNRLIFEENCSRYEAMRDETFLQKRSWGHVRASS